MGGIIDILGSPSHRVKINNIGYIYSKNGVIKIQNTDIRSCSGISALNAYVSIASSSILQCLDALVAKGSKVRITGSDIRSNNNGIKIQSTEPVYISKSYQNIGGEGNAYDAYDTDVVIHNSSIIDNKTYGINNQSTSTVFAENNYWSYSGPQLSGANKITGLVSYSPWLNTEPVAETEKVVCCSNILFLPGLEGSSLNVKEKNGENRLWLPNSNKDVQKLFLNKNGSSTLSSIYSSSPISEAYGVYSVYGKFMDFISNYAKDGTVNSWKAYSYDWRKPIYDVVLKPEKKKIGEDSLLGTVFNLASTSKTGKVTIIAHSNGGLVAKYLVKTLADMGKSDLIDKVISVAVPYLGTPEAILGLLHGDNQSIGYGFILNQTTARQLGTNMASAYTLLPSKGYFANIFSPTIAFASTTISLNNPLSISSYDEQKKFILDSSSTRPAYKDNDTDLPIKGNSNIMKIAETIHDIIDPFTWPINIARYAIVGWNKKTASGILYDAKDDCYTFSTKCIIHTALNTIFGDDTVMTKSASNESGEVASINLKEIKDTEGKDIGHGNILESKTAQGVVDNIVKDEGSNCKNWQPIKGVTCGEPDYSYSDKPKEIVVSTHSPVELHVYDSKGRHTGTIPAPKEAEIEDDVVTFYESNIPDSSVNLKNTENGDYESYVYLPDDGGTYTVVVDGLGVGSFSLDIDRTVGGIKVGHTVYSNIPTTPLLVATTTVSIPLTTALPQQGKVLDLTSEARPLMIDMDGDGRVDTSDNAQFKAKDLDAEDFQHMKDIYSKQSNIDKDVLKQMDDLIAKARKGEVKTGADYVNTVSKSLHHKINKNMTITDRKNMANDIKKYLEQFQ